MIHCKSKTCLPLRDDLLPVPGLVEDMVTVSTHTLATEQGWESAASRDHLLWNTHLLLRLGLPDNELSNLYDS